jgi:hypothetical protein
MTGRRALGLRLPAAAVAAAAAVSAAGCDVHPAAEEALVGSAATVPFSVEHTSLGEGRLASGDEIRVRFSAPLDAGSVGSRSVRVLRADGRRIVRSAVVPEGRSLRVVPASDAGFPEGERLSLRIEGTPSPRAVRSAEGASLARRHEIPFVVARSAVLDLEGPTLLGSQPADGSRDATPGAPVELRFSEPVAAGAVAAGDAISLRIDGAEVRARARTSRDGRRILVRPLAPVAPGAEVELEVHPSLLDRSGNPLHRTSPRRVAFRTRESSLREIVEEFVCDDMADPDATDCAWGEPSFPGTLVPRPGTTLLVADAGEATDDLGERDSVRFLLLVRGDEETTSVACGLRLRFSTAPAGGPLASATVDGGPYDLDLLEPSFEGSRRFARLERLADDPGPFPWEDVPGGGVAVEVPFSEPLRLDPGATCLLDVTVRPAPGARMVAVPARGRRALVEGGVRDRFVPAASLLVVGAWPGARSRWYDAGVPRPRWGAGRCTLDAEDPGMHVAVEFQTAPAAGPGVADEELASPWGADLSRLPGDRFVRFRIRFEGTPLGGRAPCAERVVMPYVAETP